MKFRSESVIDRPRDAVFAAYRDQLPEAVAYLDDIKEVVVQSREEGDGVVELHNEWVSAREVPSAMAAFVKADAFGWDDYATWDGASFTCSWNIKPHVFREAVTCTGTNHFVDEGGKTRVVLEGDFSVDASKLKGVPGFLAKRIVPQVEGMVVKLIQPNLERTSDAVRQFLDAGDA